MLLGKIAAADPGNVRLHPGDARDLVDRLPDGALGRVYLLYPDPWPKARHHKRRFASAETLAALARVMRPGAELRLATDIADYADHAVAAAAAVPALEPVVAGAPGLVAAVGGLDGDALRGEGGQRRAPAALPRLSPAVSGPLAPASLRSPANGGGAAHGWARGG
jgi:hypothetical protein